MTFGYSGTFARSASSRASTRANLPPPDDVRRDQVGVVDVTTVLFEQRQVAAAKPIGGKTPHDLGPDRLFGGL